MQSETIGKLAEALAKAQGEMESAKKDSLNPFFKNKYADLASVIEAIKEPLAKNGLSYVQFSENDQDNAFVNTTLMHSSGEWISGRMRLLIQKNDMQGLGGAFTYGRRYALSAMVGITQDDDDGETASGRTDANQVRSKMPPEAKNTPKPIQHPPEPEKPNAGHPGANGSHSDERSIVGKKINGLRAELRITDQDLKAQVFRHCGSDDFKALTLDQLKSIVGLLEAEKKIRDMKDAPWIKEIPAGSVGHE